MTWTKEDKLFKQFINREITDSVNKYWFNELAAKTINIHASELWSDNIAFNDPSQAVLDGVAESKTNFILTEDLTVSNHQCWKAESPPGTRLLDWVSDKYGTNYTIHLYDNTGAEIFVTDSVGWFFDYQTGILTINGDVSSKPRPFKVSGYRYIGGKGAGGGVVEYTTEALLLASSPPDKTIGYAHDTDTFWYRRNGAWEKKGADAIVLFSDNTTFTGDNVFEGSLTSPSGGTDSTKLGSGASAQTESAITIGLNATVLTDPTNPSIKAIAIGKNTLVDINSQQSVVIGVGANTDDNGVGNNTSNCVVIGADAKSRAPGAIVLGQNAVANGSDVVSAGTNSLAGGPDSVAIGHNAASQTESAVTLGFNAKVFGDPTYPSHKAIAIGKNTIVDVNSAQSIVIGVGANTDAGGIAFGTANSVVIGPDAKSKSFAAVVIGVFALVNQGFPNAIAIGNTATINAGNGITVGYLSSVSSSYGIAIGGSASVAGSSTNGIAVGRSAAISAGGSLALGYQSVSSSTQAIAIGQSSIASSNRCIAVGSGAQATNTYALALGYNSRAYTQRSLAIGYNAIVSTDATYPSNFGIAIGNNAFLDINSSLSIVIGSDAKTEDDGVGNQTAACVVIGVSAQSYSGGVVAIGGSARAYAGTDSSVAIGNASNVAIGCYDSVVLGHAASSSGFFGSALGSYATVSATGALAIGYFSSSAAETSIAIGSYAASSGHDAISIGRQSIASYEGAIGIGKGVLAQSDYVVCIGNNAQANDWRAIVIGAESVVYGEYGIVIGAESEIVDDVTYPSNRAIVIGNDATVDLRSSESVVIGYQAKTDDSGTSVDTAQSVVIGSGAISYGQSGIAVGLSSYSGYAAVSVGNGARGYADSSIAIGASANVALANSYAIAIGRSTYAIGASAVSVGYGSIAAAVALALGPSAQAYCTGSLAFGYSAFVTPDATYPSDWGIAIGGSATIAKRSGRSVVIGVGCNTDDGGISTDTAYSVVMGCASRSKGESSIAIGYSAYADHLRDIVIGPGCIAGGNYGIVIGVQSRIEDDLTYPTSDAILMGRDAFIDKRSSDSVVIGHGAYTSDSGSDINTENSVVIGRSAYSLGDRVVCIGSDAHADSTSSIAIGQASSASNLGVCVGAGATAILVGTTAIGTYASTGTNGTAVGQSATTTGGSGGTAVGYGSISHPTNQNVAIGALAEAGLYSGEATAVGYFARAMKSGAVALGKTAVASEVQSIAIGYDCYGSGTNVVSIGAGNRIYGEGSIAVGAGNYASKTANLLIGYNSTIVADDTYPSDYATGIGYNISIAKRSENSIVIGRGAYTYDGGGGTPIDTSNSIVMGYAARSNAAGCIVLGHGSAGNKDYCVVIGEGAQAGAYDNGGVAIGAYCAAHSYASVAIGRSATAALNYAVAIGYGSANGVGSVCVGAYQALNDGSIAIGYSASSYADNAISIGKNSSIAYSGDTGLLSPEAIAIGRNSYVDLQSDSSIVIGYGANTYNTGSVDTDDSIVIGKSGRSAAAGAIVIGRGAESYGVRSIAIGYNAQISAYDNALAIGEDAAPIADNDGVIGTAGKPIGLRGYADLDWVGGYAHTIGPGWEQDNVAAAQSAVVLNLLSSASRSEIPMVRAGSIIGVVVYSNEARTAGTLTVEVTKNGTGIGLTAVLDDVNTTVKSTTQAKDTDSFAAGDRIGIKITTDGSWTPTTADITVEVLVEE